MEPLHLNFFAIVTAALVTFAVGGLWYSPILFAKPWRRECGLSEEQLRRRRWGASSACRRSPRW